MYLLIVSILNTDYNKRILLQPIYYFIIFFLGTYNSERAFYVQDLYVPQLPIQQRLVKHADIRMS